ncbi:hypothetical protein DCO58_01435 [Helicobacter saguini]|uniref:Uncharacterized protein n=1 Tax=Helicobacter saguini TaxID=1548018 RepID=A0A347VRC3_9HELI|nr:hypothetical protein [Helicobacter saguini]MWV62953.1 hypothetical protein [Helicobacter saguini]MWV66376.1 hypothetical protein [Helicobacter saguini]MWV68729.1 hypothetical protein [Helicobacter saguini]MWV71719.1 hypothetical protein [Helicobacter saguini]TLD92164.1 hypothetical protein LS64_010760 [Helicobacter saguini]
MRRKNNMESSEIPSNLKPYYFEILFSMDIQPGYINEIISEIISGEIAKYDEGVEFIQKDKIEFKLDSKNL